jgi:DNA-binding Xre family transcriptional regulator
VCPEPGPDILWTDGVPDGRVGYVWRLREVMNDNGMVAATELLPPLRARGVSLSAVAAWRLVTQPPTRLSLSVLAALCDTFACTPSDLITTFPQVRT